MKLICTQENLKTGLAVVGRIISSTNTLPILSNVLIKTENGMLKISSTNLEIGITTSVRCKVEEDGEITVASKTFIDLVNNLPNKNIVLEKRNDELLIESENYHTKLKTLPPEDFPIIPKIEDGKDYKFDAQEVKQAIDQVVFAASTNQTQPEISGILFAVNGRGLRVVATDRYRLAERKVDNVLKDSLETEVIIPQKTVMEISRIIGSQKGELDMVFSETQVVITFGDSQIVSRLVDGQYPDYRQIIPASFNNTSIAPKSQLVSALRAAAVFGHASNSVQVIFDPEKQQILLSSGLTDLGDSTVEVPAKIEGVGSSLILNHHYFLDCLSVINSENVIIKTIDDNTPSLILPENKNNYIYLVMPIKS